MQPQSLQTPPDPHNLLHQFLHTHLIPNSSPNIHPQIQTMISKIKVLVFQYMHQHSTSQVNIQHVYEHILQQFFTPQHQLLYQYISVRQLDQCSGFVELVLLPIVECFIKECGNVGGVLENGVGWKETVECVCQGEGSGEECVDDCCFCYRCGRMFHRKCFCAGLKGVYECHECYLRYYMPDRQVTNILFKSYLPPASPHSPTISLIPLTFPLPYSPSSSHHQPILQLRIFRICPSPSYHHTYPQSCNIYLDNQLCVSYRPLLDNSSLKRRYDIPLILSISSLVSSEYIKIQEFYVGVSDWHFVCIVEVEERGEKEIMEAFMLEKGMDEQESGKYLRNLFWSHSPNIDIGLSIQELRISNICQYYRNKIEYPCRSKHCSTHYQPFDLYSFICSSTVAKSSVKRWMCPICGVRAYHIVRDLYLQKIIKEANAVQGQARKELAFVVGNGEQDVSRKCL